MSRNGIRTVPHKGIFCSLELNQFSLALYACNKTKLTYLRDGWLLLPLSLDFQLGEWHIFARSIQVRVIGVCFAIVACPRGRVLQSAVGDVWTMALLVVG